MGPRRAVRAARRSDRRGRGQAGRDRHDRDAVRRVLEHGDPALRAAPPVRLAQGPRGHRGDHRRARRRDADALRHRGVRLGLRDRARPPRDRADVDATAAHPQVPRLAARDQRVPVPDRRIGRVGPADHVARPAATPCPRNGCRPAWPASTRCSATAGSTGGAPCSSAAPPAPASRRWPRSSATPTLRRGERAMYFAFEESEAEIVRNMSSVGIDLQRWVDAGLLRFRCFRPSLLGLEAHLFDHAEVRQRVRSGRGRDGPGLRPLARSEPGRTCRRC